MPDFVFNKLVRDNIPSLQKKEGAETTYRTLSTEEHALQLRTKLVEEAGEVNESATRKELVSELADVLQVLESLCEAEGVSLDEVRKAQADKRDHAGAFNDRVFIEKIRLAEDDKWVAYYRDKPERYPEIDSL